MNNRLSLVLKVCIISLYFSLHLMFSNMAVAMETKSIEANGVDISYVEQGTGPLMILAHGSLSDHRRWINDHLPLLAENYRVVAYSMRYHGTSDWDESWPPISIDLYAKDLAAFIQALDAGPAHVVGWSMGAMVAHHTALDYPELVRSAYLFEGAAALERTDDQMAEYTKLRMALTAKSASLADEQRYAEAAAAMLNAVIGKDGFFSTLPEGAQKAIGGKGNLLSDYFEATFNPVSKFTCDQIKNSKVPTVYVTGDSTVAYFSVALGEHYKPCFGMDRIISIAGGNHVWPGAKFEDFARSTHDFASKH